MADNLTLIYEKSAENLSYNVRNYIPIDSEITIEEGKEFWFGVYTDPIFPNYNYAWAADKGPAVSEKGDLHRLYYNDWVTLSSFGINSNFCIEVILENPEGKMVTSISKVYPNPGENILNIRTSFPEGRIEIYDILGKMIYKQYITEEVTKISTEGWAKGMYLWKVFSEGKETESGKWIKQ